VQLLQGQILLRPTVFQVHIVLGEQLHHRFHVVLGAIAFGKAVGCLEILKVVNDAIASSILADIAVVVV
jgi:hypothetical protein